MSIITNTDMTLSRKDFLRIKDVIYKHCGINLVDGKQALVTTRLGKRLRTLKNFKSISEYVDYVLSPENKKEFSAMVDAISTNLTCFFREKQHLDYMVKTALPSLMKRKRSKNDKRIRIWSAGCSSGEEPYSLAISLLEHVPANENWDIKILASDVSTRMLERAQAGSYDKSQVENVPLPIKNKYFTTNVIENEKVFQVTKTLQNIIRFRYLNLMEPWPFHGPFDFIYCRNVMIYFDKPTQENLVSRYWNLLDDKGILFIGHSESLSGIKSKFSYVIPAAYSKH